ncbi:DNA polymerase III subunit beta [Crocinitomix catalasitica]|uniref:DNA polymerase III subunit beta n=1 Tax=Crocinitomix catalasitica TaxID=184607 RepID=UPI0004838F51|nr:DNA polymerase III subunit beta [Crocinitomix catalasitica]
MNFIISSSTLLKNLQNISGVLNSSNSLPILDNFLFELANGELTISASDLENTMKTSVSPDESKEDGRIAIPAKLLLDTLKNFSDQPLSFLIDPSNFGIEISSDYGKYKLVGQNADDFPKSPELENASSLVMKGEIIANAIEKTLFATGNDELRPVMSGVFCQFSADKLTFVATDAHKLVRYGRFDSTASTASDFILPKKPLNLLKQNVDHDVDVTLSYTNTTVRFNFGSIELTSRLIDGKYPNYEAVIPDENPNVLTVDRISFLNSIKRVSIFSNKTTHQVKLKVAGSELSISAEDLDFSNEAKERLTCNYQGDDMEIGFNSKFLMEMLNHISTTEVILEMSEPNKAGILLPSANENENEDILMLVMPVMIR